jgi:hypothetical protein
MATNIVRAMDYGPTSRFIFPPQLEVRQVYRVFRSMDPGNRAEIAKHQLADFCAQLGLALEIQAKINELNDYEVGFESIFRAAEPEAPCNEVSFSDQLRTCWILLIHYFFSNFSRANFYAISYDSLTDYCDIRCQ